MVNCSSIPTTTGCISGQYYWNNIKHTVVYKGSEEYQKLNSLKNKDLAAFSWMYDKYSPALYGLILKISVHSEIADAILLKSFIEIWKKIETYDETRSSLFIWMTQITIQQCRERLSLSNSQILENMKCKIVREYGE